MWQHIWDHNAGKSWRILTFLLHIWKRGWMLSASKLFTYLFYVWGKYDVTVTLWNWWAATASAACVARLRTVADWWRSWPMTNTPACLCLCQWCDRVTVNLFSLYLMNFMFYTTLDAVGSILKVHYKSMKCDVSFSQGSVSTLFRWGEHVFHVCVKMIFLFTAVHKLSKSK